MQSAADQYLNSLEVPNSDEIINQLNTAKETLRDTQSILSILRDALETTKQLPEGGDRTILMRELESNINRHELIIERESVKLSVKEKYLKNVMKREIHDGATSNSNTL
ncbi:hypothetical protein PCANC_21203 [Puccinia coronata f. sp. avenae]|uniref:Mediator complex subunit 9 n=1 Tax=Puccinia coronata f. sp. avenae TaxID=200324 RepID=A0A2N5TRC1_9BASI|nr:hypothetical protein PCANC_23045 [Puccinia coronata f. sp. avenae]PLW29959.1 hypothetical protein PCASD_18888 [Puccinia coronata f. sp. avenae]PLW30438.1 hypothetical protein PCANC_21203 [Puccinia coronata f. sp. avenae]